MADCKCSRHSYIIGFYDDLHCRFYGEGRGGQGGGGADI